MDVCMAGDLEDDLGDVGPMTYVTGQSNSVAECVR